MIKRYLKYFIVSIFALICLLPNYVNFKNSNIYEANAASLGYDVNISAENYFSYFDVSTGKTEYYAYSRDRDNSTINLIINIHF